MDKDARMKEDEIEPIGREGPIHERAPRNEENEEEDDDDGLAEAIDNISLVGEERLPFKDMRTRWIAAAEKAHETFMSSAHVASMRILGSVPRSPAEWESLGRNLFGKAVLDYIRRGDPVVTSGLIKVGADESPEKLLNWIQEHEMAILRGYRSIDWVDPNYTHDLKERVFDKPPFAVDIGTRYAVCLAYYKDHKEENLPITIMVVDMLATDKSSANRKCALNREEAAKKQPLSVVIAEDRKNGVSFASYQHTVHPRITEPDRATVHGSHLALLWRKSVASRTSDPARRTPALCDLIEVCALPRCSPSESTFIEMPADAVLDFDLHYPYMCVRCNGASVCSITEALHRSLNLPGEPVHAVDHETMKAYSSVAVVLNIKSGAFENMVCLEDCSIMSVFISPAMRCPADEATPPSELALLCTLDSADVTSRKRGVTIEAPLLAAAHHTQPSFHGVSLCANEEAELKDFEACGKRYKSKALEPASLSQRFPGGHFIQITPNNVGILIAPNAPTFPEPHTYICRDAQVVDMAIYGNMVVSLTPDNRIEFAAIRHASEEEAKQGLKPTTAWRLEDLERHGDRKHFKPRDDEKHTVGTYKAIWMCSDRVKVLFPDGTLVSFTGLNDEEMTRYREVQKKAHHEQIKRAAMKAETERQVAAELARHKGEQQQQSTQK